MKKVSLIILTLAILMGSGVSNIALAQISEHDVNGHIVDQNDILYMTEQIKHNRLSNDYDYNNDGSVDDNDVSDLKYDIFFLDAMLGEKNRVLDQEDVEGYSKLILQFDPELLSQILGGSKFDLNQDNEINVSDIVALVNITIKYDLVDGYEANKSYIKVRFSGDNKVLKVGESYKISWKASKDLQDSMLALDVIYLTTNAVINIDTIHSNGSPYNLSDRGFLWTVPEYFNELPEGKFKIRVSTNPNRENGPAFGESKPFAISHLSDSEVSEVSYSDLSIKSVRSKSVYKLGDSVYFRVLVTNTGDQDINSFRLKAVKSNSNDEHFLTRTINKNIPAGKSRWVTFGSSLLDPNGNQHNITGIYNLLITIDPFNEIQESNEDNNYFKHTIKVIK
ncbi:hypothetical protein HOE31_04555 [bacterium]|jgi:hypothetical protein|nr:hypothetical protein [bacterium]MBT4122191.1 hypothetical protein [bacterium]MBT4335079.1 hypothetical protein [bacterium]MBT4495792.1 hypothetical protein [bacterium]MBT4763820.1 hypothetical protein [bacterium]